MKFEEYNFEYGWTIKPAMQGWINKIVKEEVRNGRREAVICRNKDELDEAADYVWKNSGLSLRIVLRKPLLKEHNNWENQFRWVGTTGAVLGASAILSLNPLRLFSAHRSDIKQTKMIGKAWGFYHVLYHGGLEMKNGDFATYFFSMREEKPTTY